MKNGKEIEASKDFPVGVFHCSPTNSTPFTNCCKVAICSHESCCPRCGLYIVGYDSSNPEAFRFKYAFSGRREF